MPSPHVSEGAVSRLVCKPPGTEANGPDVSAEHAFTNPRPFAGESCAAVVRLRS